MARQRSFLFPFQFSCCFAWRCSLFCLNGSHWWVLSWRGSVANPSSHRWISTSTRWNMQHKEIIIHRQKYSGGNILDSATLESAHDCLQDPWHRWAMDYWQEAPRRGENFRIYNLEEFNRISGMKRRRRNGRGEERESSQTSARHDRAQLERLQTQLLVVWFAEPINCDLKRIFATTFPRSDNWKSSWRFKFGSIQTQLKRTEWAIFDEYNVHESNLKLP